MPPHTVVFPLFSLLVVLSTDGGFLNRSTRRRLSACLPACLPSLTPSSVARRFGLTTPALHTLSRSVLLLFRHPTPAALFLSLRAHASRALSRSSVYACFALYPSF